MTTYAGTAVIVHPEPVVLWVAESVHVIHGDLFVERLVAGTAVATASINPMTSAVVDSFSVMGAVFNSGDVRYRLQLGDVELPLLSFTIRRTTVDELTFTLPDELDDFSGRVVLYRVVSGVSEELFSGFVTRYDKPKLVAVSDAATETFSRVIAIEDIVYYSFSGAQVRARVVTDQNPRVGDTVIMDGLDYTVTGVTEYVSLESVMTELICA